MQEWTRNLNGRVHLRFQKSRLWGASPEVLAEHGPGWCFMLFGTDSQENGEVTNKLIQRHLSCSGKMDTGKA